MRVKSQYRFLSWEMAVRVFADIIIINMATLLAFSLRFYYIFMFTSPAEGTDYHQLFWNFLAIYLNSAWLLTLICIIIFSFSGFYSHGRAYRSKYKVLMIFQAGCLIYLLFGFISYFFHREMIFPRTVLILALFLSLTFLIAARIWSMIWGRVLASEKQKSQVTITEKVNHVLVIGGGGYIGSALLSKLLHAGYRVRVIDLFIYGRKPIQDLLDHPHLEVINTDFRRIDSLVEGMQGVEAVIHLGAIVGDPACALDEELTIDVNLMATRMIAEVAKGCNISRFIFASTCSVYGASDQILEERSVLNPISLYARSKLASERVLTKMEDDRFAPSILRFGTIYGLSGRIRFDLVVNLLAAKAVAEGRITIYGPQQWRPFLHVDDAAMSVMKVLEAPLSLIRRQVFNVGSNAQNYTLGEVGRTIQHIVPGVQVVEKGVDGDRRNYRVNFNKIQNELKFTPQWNLEEGIQQVIDVIRSGQIEDYDDPQYSNVKFLSEEKTNSLMKNANGWVSEILAQG